MRVLQVCNGFPPAVGGTETHNFTLTKYLLDNGYDVEVIVTQRTKEDLKNKNYSDEMINVLHSDKYTLPELKNIPIYNVIANRPGIVHYDLMKTVKMFEKGKNNFDVIDIHSPWHAVSMNGNRKIILSLHFFEMICPRIGYPLPCIGN